MIKYLFRRLIPCSLSLALMLTFPAHAGVILSDNFSDYETGDNPWSGVDGNGQLKVRDGTQQTVATDGSITNQLMGPSIAVGDLNGDGLPDLLVGDARGFFWFYANSGTKDTPKFTTGEVLPLWFADPFTYDNFIWPEEGADGVCTHNYVPRIQLIAAHPGGLLDLVVGNYLGQLFYLRNSGSKNAPAFNMPTTKSDIIIPTHREGKLWTNYLAPCLFNWTNKSHFDLLVGDGAYSANSIFFFSNMGSNDQPSFSEDNMSKIVPGMGREHLTPQVVSWNGDGKPDILTTERAGNLNLFLNTGTDPKTNLPMYDLGTHVTVGGQDSLGERSTATLAALEVGKPPGLVIGSDDGHISYAENTGTASSYSFGSPSPVNGTPNTRPKILKPRGWHMEGGYGSPFEILCCTNAQVEKGFTPPAPGINNALRFYIDLPPKPQHTFPQLYYPKIDLRTLKSDAEFKLKAHTQYKLSCWVRASGNISNLMYQTHGFQWVPTTFAGKWQDFNGTMGSVNDSWTQASATLSFESISDNANESIGFSLSFLFSGNGSLYIADLKIEEP